MNATSLAPARGHWPAFLLLGLAWLAAYATRPFLLGFYDDDWAVLLLPTQSTTPWSFARFAYHLEIFANRPVTGILTFLLSSLAEASPHAWHAALAVMVLAVALALRAALQALLELLERPSPWAPDLATALWLVAPWMLGITAWPAAAPGVTATATLALAARALFRGWHAGHNVWRAPALWFLLSILTYEAFYGQFAVLLLIGVACGVRRKLGARWWWRPLLAMGGVQLLAIALNRAVALLVSNAPSKQFNADWCSTFASSLHSLRFLVGASAREFSPLLESALLVAVVIWIALALWHVRKVHVRRAGLLLAVCACGTALALFIFALVGHRLSAVGLSSRTTVGLSWWCAIAVAATCATFRPAPGIGRLACGLFAAGILGALALACQLRIREWGAAWQKEQQILAHAPLEDLRRAAPGDIILYTGPSKHKGIRVFGYTWNLNRAMDYTYPELRELFFCEGRADRITTWDGRHFAQRLLTAPESSSRRSVWNQRQTGQVWLWDPDSSNLVAVTAPFVHPAASVGNSPALVVTDAEPGLSLR